MPARSSKILPRQQSSAQSVQDSSVTSMSVPSTTNPRSSAYAMATANPAYNETAAPSVTPMRGPPASMPASSMYTMATSSPVSNGTVSSMPAGRPSGPPSGPPSGAPQGQPSGSNAPAPRPQQGRPEPKKECFQKADGTSICKWSEYDRTNSTDVMNQGGVYDYHNAHSDSQGVAYAGKIPGTDIPGAIAGIPTGPPAAGAPAPTVSFGGTMQPATPTSGATVFQGSKSDSSTGSQDIHESPNDFSNHQDASHHNGIDWQAKSQGQGSNTAADIGIVSDGKSESLVTNKDGVGDSTSTSESKTAGGIDVSNQSQRGNITADIDFKNESKSQKEEHLGNGVYEFHEDVSAKGSMSQGFNGAGAVADAGKAYGEMAQSLGLGAPRQKREVDAGMQVLLQPMEHSNNTASIAGALSAGHGGDQFSAFVMAWWPTWLMCFMIGFWGNKPWQRIRRRALIRAELEREDLEMIIGIEVADVYTDEK
ncbi:hypothetical protein LTR17_005484 [Elasticomyces elasticus]|nr:hypothetical protein LTR17_005484 [Elasticomyces elasticus]